MPRPFMALQLIFLLLCLLSLVSAAERNLVANLPGFNGVLPFQLETGYVNVDEENGVELFYYFIQSEGDPRHDPVLLWLTGGDRCSVLSGLAFEIGPVKFVIEPYNGSLPRLQYNPYTWTKAASIIFVDSPVGAGFSFSRSLKGYDVGDISASLQLKKFLAEWFSEHPDFLTNPFYIGGDSYAGKIIPFLAQKISEDLESGVSRPALNLKGYLVGNPGTGEGIDVESRVPYAHGHGIISDQLYETIMEHCHGEDYSKPKNVICAQALNRFSKLLDECMMAHILYKTCVYVSPRPKDGTEKRKSLKEETEALSRKPPRPPMDCVTYKNYLSYFWANNNITRDALGIRKGSKGEWLRCHDGDLPYSQDIKSSIKYHRNVTLKGYRVLVYSGDQDAVIPFIGTQAWVRSLNFPIVDDWRAWHLDGQSAGVEATLRLSMNQSEASPCSGGGFPMRHFDL
ncbi:serine carboxypeptidase-like 18 isoform X2 [Setaria viridis]|uniref:serine carboxypeptidase-like 18 isoform X2 n=1 Tax=Setaria viridis TaxID=4556 RepID=UPI0014933A06|nr:serine carboxypeptidase-like 18 isoform X2 [Setaria viridis]